MLQVVAACLLLSSANCIRLGKESRSMNNVPAPNEDLRQECEGKTQQWSSEGGVRRLEGPAFFFMSTIMTEGSSQLLLQNLEPIARGLLHDGRMLMM